MTTKWQQMYLDDLQARMDIGARRSLTAEEHFTFVVSFLRDSNIIGDAIAKVLLK